MRTAPCGFVTRYSLGTFRLGAECAAFTHGHPSGYLPAGVVARTVELIAAGASLDDALNAADADLATWSGHEETRAALEAGRATGRHGVPEPKALERLGGAWTGHEALAISVACALGAIANESEPEACFRSGVLAAVNHSGDSDSTGAITGNFLGALLGVNALPTEWLEPLELRDELDALAQDLHTELTAPPTGDDGRTTPEWWERYPGW
jgi:ADP-ribosylglycohydrolase